MNSTLPIWRLHEEIESTLRSSNRMVLVGPTGSGKSTQLPQMLLDGGFANTIPRGRILVLQPRRLAARTLASRVARERSCLLGGEVGYQIRFDDATTEGTRISYITEGILLRRLQSDPLLEKIAAIVFDEFHERNLNSDIALGLAKKLQSEARPDLRLIVMSATLQAETVAAYLSDASGAPCPMLISEARQHPVDVQWHPAPQEECSMPERAAEILRQCLDRNEPGDALIFMPGFSEINATIQAISLLKLPEKILVLALHGDLPPEQQDLAFAESATRKVVVATNVAETSITIPGIRIVIDSGLARVARFDARRGIHTLHLEPISQASADQRTGRAGRTAPGVSHRLWSETEHAARSPQTTPEIQRSDLAEVVLLLHSLGVAHSVDFPWLDKPDLMALETAESLLLHLGALRKKREDEKSVELTPIGRRMLRIPLHPRSSRMLIEAARQNCLEAAALCAALTSGRDLLARIPRHDKQTREARELFETGNLSDFFPLIRAFQYAARNNFNVDACRRHGIHAQVAREVASTFDQIVRVAQQDDELRDASAAPAEGIPHATDESIMKSIFTGFADQLCRRADSGTLDCRVVGGSKGVLMRESVVQAPLFVAATVREVTMQSGEKETLLGLATAVKPEWLAELFPGSLTTVEVAAYDRGRRTVRGERVLKFGDLAISSEPFSGAVPGGGKVLVEAFLAREFELPNLNHVLRQSMMRSTILASVFPELLFPNVDQEFLRAWLAKQFEGAGTVREVQKKDLAGAWQTLLGPEKLAAMEQLAPEHFVLPGGKRIKIIYAYDAESPHHGVSGKIQIKEMDAGELKTHPRVARDKIALRMILCSLDGDPLREIREGE